MYYLLFSRNLQLNIYTNYYVFSLKYFINNCIALNDFLVPALAVKPKPHEPTLPST